MLVGCLCVCQALAPVAQESWPCLTWVCKASASPGEADVTLPELGILLGWVSQQVCPAVSPNLCLLHGLIFTVKNKKLCFIWQSD